MFPRRHLLISSTVIAALAACSTFSNSSVATVAADVNIIVAGLQGTVPAIAAAAGISSAGAASVTAALNSLQTAAVAIGKTANVTSAQPIVAQIEADINTIVGVAATIPGLPAPVTLALVAAQVLLPVIETAIGMVTKPPTPTVSRLRTVAPTMTPPQARLILRGLAVAH